jgi:hypothetical protein
MTAIHGIRPGTAPDTKLGSEWRYVKSQHPEFQALEKDSRAAMMYESELQRAIDAAELSTKRLRLAYLLLHGGHAEKGLIAQSGMTLDADPASVLALATSGMPTDVVSTAYARK